MVFPMPDIAAATNNFHANNKIGEGACGDVFKGRLGHVPVAVKRLLPESAGSASNLLGEVAMLSKYRHPHLIALFGHTNLVDNQPCLIYPLMTQGSLRDRLDCKEGTETLSWDIRMKIAFQTASGLAFLHKPYQGAPVLLHLDVKSENILLDQQYDVRVADFGLVRVLNRNEVLREQAPAGTLGSDIAFLFSFSLSLLFCNHRVLFSKDTFVRSS